MIFSQNKQCRGPSNGMGAVAGDHGDTAEGSPPTLGKRNSTARLQFRPMADANDAEAVPVTGHFAQGRPYCKS